MFDSFLFLGIRVDDALDQALADVNPHLLDHLVKNGSDYLHETTLENQRYIGKNLGRISEIENLDLLEANIYSLLKKLLPDYPFEPTSLVLFPQAEESPQ